MLLNKFFIPTLFLVGIYSSGVAQLAIPINKNTLATSKPSVQTIVDEASNNSQLELLAHELLDVIGSRLVGTPQMKQANDWVVSTYNKWGITAQNDPYGEWKSWERGSTTVDLVAPRKQQLVGRQLAWNPNMKKAIEAETILIPFFETKEDFESFLPKVKGKIVLCSPYFTSGRPEYQWNENATEGDLAVYKSQKEATLQKWNANVKIAANSMTNLIEQLERAGAVGIITNAWTGIIGANRIFDAKTKVIPQVDLINEDYGLIHRLTAYGNSPKLKIKTESKHTGSTQVFNTIATIPGTTRANEFIMLSAHLDAWDGAQGATDNGTGTLLMMEVARIIQKLYPNPKRTILIGHWNSEEQGLNGSTAFVNDHPEIIKNLKVVFNQDSGTGRINYINAQGFVQAEDFLGRWMSQIPDSIRKYIETTFPGEPQTRGTDNVPFVAAGVPAFAFGSQSWGYGAYTWHTNLDTYDKIVFSEVLKNIISTAILTIEAADDENEISNEKIQLKPDTNGKETTWPKLKEPTRKGRMDK